MSVEFEAKYLASYVTFRQLYDDGKNDIYGIISRFVEEIIITSHTFSFNVVEMSESIRSQFGFVIPDYVVQTAIRRLKYVSRENKAFVVDYNQLPKSDLSTKYASIVANNDNLVEKLVSYVEEKKGVLLLGQKEALVKDFCSFLLDDTISNGFSDVISAFILENQDSDIYNQISLIKEGAVLFAGINYNSDISEKSAWKENIVIFVESEILFHLAGYNGEIFKRIAEDLFGLISEMNSKGNKKVISVRYFSETEREIDDFFLKAEDIVSGRDIISAENYAMKAIVKGCMSPSDVVMRKNEFLRVVSSYGISKEEDHDYYCKENSKYNLESSEYIERYHIEDDKLRYLKHINYVNILRKGIVEKDLKKARYIVLTETGKILRMSKDICIEGMPYAVNMNFFTNRLWYDLNKGFGAKEFPSSFNVILKSQIVLSSLLSQSVSEKYENAKRDFVSKKIDSEQLADAIILLREESKKPEDIYRDDIDKILSFISEETIEIYTSEKAKLANDLNEKKEEIAQISKILEKKEDEIRLNTEANNKLESEKMKYYERALSELENRYEDEIARKERADELVRKKIKRFRFFEVSLIIIYYGLMIFLLFRLSDTNKNILLGLFTLIPPVITMGISVIKDKKFEISEVLKVFEKIYERKIKKKIYFNRDVSVEKISDLKVQIDSMNDVRG